jgi:PAS domain S-box-containing protein
MRFLNMAILEVSGYPASDFINNEVRTYASIIHPDDRSFVEKVVFEAIEQKRPYIIEYRIVNAHGNIRWIYEKGQGVFGKNNEVLWLDGVIFDNTDRKKIEEDKTKIEGRLENKVTELSIMNEISEVLLSSRELNEILHMILIGATAYQALGFNRAFLFLINEEETMLEGKVATGSLAIEEAYKIWEGLTHESHTLKELLQSRHGELSKEDEPINNLMKKMKIPLREGETIFTQAVYENKSFNITDGTDNLLIDKDFISLLGTDTFALVPLVSRGKTLGVLLADNFINKKPILDEDVERLGAFANHASLAIENSHLYKSSREKVEELSRAYNELQENRDKLLRYERLSAVGNVAARVTHEIRNPLVAIGGFARRILKKDQDGEANRNYVKIIVEEIDRLENTLTDILSFAKPTLPKCDTVDLNEGIKSILKILDIEITKSNIRTEEHFDPALPMLWLDENQIRRVVINLIRNAIQAMPDGGTIIISTSREDQWVKVEIADTGVGISDEDISKLFDAFFTSKSTGSGLGLTVSAQIINNHGGTIEVQKREPQGTLFIIRLPIKKPSALT